MIIGIKEEGKVTLAFSSFDGFSPVGITSDMTNRENVGIWKIKGNPRTIMGCVFPSTESDAFRYEEEMFQGEINYDKLTDEIVPAMEGFAKDKEYIGNENGEFKNFLIAQDGKLFRISSEHVVTEIDSTVALSGYGADFAKCILRETQGESAIDRIKKAFEFSAYERQCDCYPISIIDTQTCRVRTLTKYGSK